MKAFTTIFFVFFVIGFLNSFLTESESAVSQKNVYIVYMGAASSTDGTLRDDHHQLLTSLLARNEDVVVHNYKHAFSGFSARLSPEEARLIRQEPGVVSVFPETKYKLYTTHSWEFLKQETHLDVYEPGSDSNSLSRGTDTIIGILDTGIWPESESFNDKYMGPIPARWKGTCVEATDFKKSNCNRKLIGARFYTDPDEDPPSVPTPRDTNGHGTHVAATAAGSVVKGASYYSLAAGTAKGGSPSSRIAVYKVCSSIQCSSSSILAGFDDAIADGVDIINLSFGSPNFVKVDFYSDPISIGAFHAVDKGISVVSAAGNDGPDPTSVANVAPWLLTVGATTIDRQFQSDIVLGGNKVIKGQSINFSDMKKSPTYPLIYGKSASTDFWGEDEARKCIPHRMNDTMIKGKIVLCENDEIDFSNHYKMEGMIEAGGIGIVMIDDWKGAVASYYGTFPFTVISSKEDAEIRSYINSTKNPVATILPTVSVTKQKPAPIMGYFSSRGPNYDTRSLMKPDIAAPGVNILAAWIGNDTKIAPEGRNPPKFNILSGTSMASPHVSGIAAQVKSRNPTWSPSAIKSAIMTTAIQTNNMGGLITTENGIVATGYDFGAGQVTLTGPLQPGLVYETTTLDYLNFMCYFGYNLTKIKLVAKEVPIGFNCPNKLSVKAISNINYPSIAISSFKKSAKVRRTVKNVGAKAETIYKVTIDAPKVLNVRVFPDTLQFTKINKTLSYQVSFNSAAATLLKEDVFGSILWLNGKYKVRAPFVVSSKANGR